MQPWIASLQRASSENAPAVVESGLGHFSAGAAMALFESGGAVPDFVLRPTLQAFEQYRFPVVWLGGLDDEITRTRERASTAQRQRRGGPRNCRGGPTCASRTNWSRRAPSSRR
jgi:hypothetical protein